MTAPDISTIESAERGSEAAHTKTTAEGLAKIIAAGITDQGTPPAAVPQPPPASAPGPTPPTSEQPAAFTTDAPAPAPAAAPAPQPAAEPEEPSFDYEAMEAALRQAGLNFTSYQDVPESLRPVWAQMAEATHDLVETALEDRLAASEAIQRVNEFGHRLEQSPDLLLLSLALTRPDVFSQAVEVVQAMEQDPQMKQNVIQRLETQASLAEVQRREKLLNERERVGKARQVSAEAKRAARKYNVPWVVAEKVIAAVVKANGGDLDVGEVDGYIKELSTSATPAPKPPRMASPQTLQNQQAAPTTPAPTAAPSPAPAPRPGTLQTDAERKGGGGRFRNLIKDAASRLRQVER